MQLKCLILTIFVISFPNMCCRIDKTMIIFSWLLHILTLKLKLLFVYLIDVYSN